MMNKIRNQLAEQQLSLREVVCYGLGMFGGGMGGLGPSMYLSFFWTDIACIPLGYVSGIMLISRLWDGSDDVLIGWFMGRTKSKYGLARPWILRMTPVALVFMLMLFYVPDIGNFGKAAWAFIAYNGYNVFLGTFVMLGLQSLTSLMTPSPKGRMTLSLTAQITNAVASILASMFLASGLAHFGGGEQGYFYFFGLLSVIGAALILSAFFGTKEKVRQIEQNQQKPAFGEAMKSFVKNKWWMIATLYQLLAFVLQAFGAVSMYYVTSVAGNAAYISPFATVQNLTAFAIPLFLPPLIHKYGPNNAANLGLVLAAGGCLLPLIDPSSLLLLVLSGALRGIGTAGMFSTRMAVMADIADYGEYKTGKRTDSLVYSGISLSAKIGMGITGAAITMILDGAGYVGGAAVQTPQALSSITFLFTWVQAICCGAIILTLLWLKGLEKEMPAVRAELDRRRALSEKIKSEVNP